MAAIKYGQEILSSYKKDRITGNGTKDEKYGIKLALAAAVFCMAMPFASFAGTWKSDANGMWYQFDDGTVPDRKCWRI